MTDELHKLQTGMTLKVHPQGCIHVYDASGKEVHWEPGVEDFVRKLHPLFMGILLGTLMKVSREYSTNGWPSVPTSETEATQLARSAVASSEDEREA